MARAAEAEDGGCSVSVVHRGCEPEALFCCDVVDIHMDVSERRLAGPHKHAAQHARSILVYW